MIATPFDVMGLPAYNDSDVVEAIRSGFPGSALRRLKEQLRLTQGQLAAALNIPVGSIARRLSAKSLSQDESDRMYRLARIYAFALDVLGKPTRARHWLTTPNQALAGATPLSILDTEIGARRAEALLGHIRYGIIS